MPINKLTAGSKNNPFNSKGSDVASTVNSIIDTIPVKIADFETAQDAISFAQSNSKVLTGDATELAAITVSSSLRANDLSLSDNNVNALQFFNITASARAVNVTSSTIQSTDGIAINEIATTGENNSIIGSHLIGASYGYLSNEPSGGQNQSSGFILSNNFIYSDRADAIELNHPNGFASDYVMVSNVLETGNGSTFVGSGFGFGVAATQGWVFGDTAIKHSRREAIHVEDTQKFGMISNVYCRETEGSGALILAPVAAQGTAHGVLMSNVNLKHTGTKTGFHGVILVNDTNGTLEGNLLNNIRVEGFDQGFSLGGGKSQVVNNLHAIDCNYAMNITTAGKVYGSGVMSTNCPILCRGNNRARFPFIRSTTTPTAIAEYVGGTTQVGMEIKGVSFPFQFVHGGSGTETIQITPFDLPWSMGGRCVAMLQGTTNYFRLEAYLTWNGTTLSVSNLVARHNGAPTGATFVASGGKLAIQVNSSTALNSSLDIEFEGSIHYR